MSETSAQTPWPSTLLVLGFFVILAGVGVAEATEGTRGTAYVVLGGVMLIAAGLVGFLVQRVLRFRDALRLRPGRY